MPPKVKVTKEEIIHAAVNIVRSSGAQALNARTVAAALNCSTQPVYFNFSTMEELRLAVAERADAICNDYIKKEVEEGTFAPYKASGMAYIRFAKEEKELFKLLYMRDRTTEVIPESNTLSDQMEALVHDNTGISGMNAKLFHFEMWAYVHGIASMVATDFMPIDWDLASRMLTDAYQGMRKHYGLEG